MQVVSSVEQFREFELPGLLALVPTMGALHRGHLALVRRARAECENVVASVFVNPLQFGANEDLATYPRDFDGDCEKLAAAGVDLLFAPAVDEMYPPGFATTIDVGEIGTRFEGAIRPDHFRGVATVVAKLLHVVAPHRVYFGQKDAQQTAVVRTMVRDLAFPVDVTIVPTVREPDGLALSSRNVYLSEPERAQAPTLHRALEALRETLARRVSKSDAIAVARGVLSPLAQAEYFDVVDADSFAPIDTLRGPAFVIGAARFGTTRLLDNLWIAA